jgi:outer membrane protein assembly factor BamB
MEITQPGERRQHDTAGFHFLRAALAALLLAVLLFPRHPGGSPARAAEPVWNIQTVDSAGDVGKYASLAFDPQGYPAISYYDDSNDDLKFAWWSGSAWGIQTVDSQGDVGKYTSLAFDLWGNSAISYDDENNKDLKFARWTGTSWDIQTVDNEGNVGWYTSLAFDPQGNPGISYYSHTSADLRFARWNSTGWNIETPDASYAGWYTSLAFDPQGNPAISYYDGATRDLNFVHWTGSAWDIKTVDNAGGGYTGWYTSLAFDPQGYPAISYYDATNKDLKLARWRGTNWDIQTVDTSGAVGEYTSLAFDSLSNPAISYYDRSNGNLKLARWTGSAWDIQTVDTNGDVGQYTSLAFDPWGNPAISYYDATNGDLKFAIANRAPDQPGNVSPGDGAAGVSLSPTLMSSAFSDPDSGDTHAASQWQITTIPGDYSSPVYDSGADAANLTQLTIPWGTLAYGTTYYWRVRHQDSNGNWSAFSPETSFSTPGVEAVTAAAPWAMFRHDLQHTGRSPYSGPSSPALRWSFSTGDDIKSSPAIAADGTIYVGSNDHKLYAINPDGSLKWSFSSGDDIRSSPAIAPDGTVYVGSDDGKLYALNPDGSLKWSFATGDWILSSPAVIPNGTIYVGSADGDLYAINPDGSLRWSFTIGSWVVSSPAVAPDGTIYIGDGSNLYALNPDGTLRWSYKTGDIIESSPAIGADGTIYVGSWDGRLYALNPDGSLKWSFTTGDSINSSPAIAADGTIYIGSHDHKLYALDPEGTLKGSFTTGDIIYFSSIAIGADGTVYAGSSDNKLYAINPNGSLKWSFATGSDIISSPAIGADSTVYVGSDDGKLYAIGKAAEIPAPALAAPGEITRITPDTDTTPAFTWKAVNGAASYEVRIDTGDWIDIGKVTSYTHTSPLSSGSHTFSVRAKDNAGNPGLAGSRSFSIALIPLNTPPRLDNISAAQRESDGKVVVSYDISDAQQSSVSITLQYWNGSAWVDASAASGAVGKVSVGRGKTILWDAAADFPGQYRPDMALRIIADDGQPASNRGKGDSPAFTLDTAPPEGYGAASPQDNATAVPLRPTLTTLIASDDSPPLSYRFVLARDSRFTQVVKLSPWQSSPSWEPPALDAATTYWWRVRTRDKFGNLSPWSPAYRFTTVAVGEGKGGPLNTAMLIAAGVIILLFLMSPLGLRRGGDPRKRYERKLRKWEAEGYDVSDLKDRWFK